MRIGRETSTAGLLAEIQKLLLAQSTFEEGARVDARPGMTLDVDEIAAVLIRRSVPEVTKPDVIERGGRLKARDVATEFGGFLVGAQNDRNRVPANDGADAMLDGTVGLSTSLQYAPAPYATTDELIALVLRRAHRTAEALNASNEARAILHLTHSFADELAITNPQFDRLRFIRAATDLS